MAQKEQADWVYFQLQKAAEGEELKFKEYEVEKINYITTQNPLSYCVANRPFELGFSVCSKLYLKEFYLCHRFDLKINFEDYPQTLDFCAAHPRTAGLNEALYFYTYNPKSISRHNWTEQKIRDYQTGMNYVYDIYKDRLQELSLIIKNVFGRLLKRQLSIIRHADKKTKKGLQTAFAAELMDLDAKGCVRLGGNKFKNWLRYRWLIFKGKRGEK